MKYALLAIILTLSLSGCYTMLYPPVSEMANDYNDGSVMVIPDSIAGTGVTIINQNQIILDRYYQEPYYYRSGYWGGSAYWDPYYYDARRYHRKYYWRQGRYYPNDSPGVSTPKEKTPRRTEDYRQSGSLPSIPEPANEPVNVRALRPATPIAQPAPEQPAAEQTSAAQVVKPDDKEKILKTAPEAKPSENKKESESKQSSQEKKTSRRGSARER